MGIVLSESEKFARDQEELRELESRASRGQSVDQTRLQELKSLVQSRSGLTGSGYNMPSAPGRGSRQSAFSSPTTEDFDDGDEEVDWSATPQREPFGVDLNVDQAEISAQTAPPDSTDGDQLKSETPAERQRRLAEEAARPPVAQASANPPEAVDGVRPPPGSTPPTQPEEEQGNRDDVADNQPQTPRSPQKQPSKPPADDQANQGLWNQTKNWFRKPLTKEFWVAIWEFILANGWWIAIIVVLVVGAILLFAYFTSSANSGANGKTPVQAANAIDNNSAIQKLAALSGGSNSTHQTTLKTINDISTALAGMANGTTDATKLGLINTAKTAVNTCLTGLNSNAPTASDDCNNAIKAVQAALAAFDNAAIPPVQGRKPVNDSDMIDPGTLGSPLPDDNFNADLHLGTPLRLVPASDNSGHGTYIYTGGNKGDAVDIYTKDSADIFPSFTGDVVDVSNDASGANTKKVVIQNGDYQILYAFINPTVKKGDKITNLNNKIGTAGKISGTSLVHIELNYCGISLVTTQTDKQNKNSASPNHTTWGAYYWEHLKEKLKF